MSHHLRVLLIATCAGLMAASVMYQRWPVFWSALIIGLVVTVWHERASTRN